MPDQHGIRLIAYLLSFSLKRIVVDTNVLTGALLSSVGWNRRVIRLCLEQRVQPVIGHTLFLEYDDVLGRRRLFERSPLSPVERQEFFEAFLSVCEWVQVYYSWRPNLKDEGDNHVVELAVAAGSSIVTNNVRDFAAADVRFPGIDVLTPKQFLEQVQ
jgi:putative PIN family toxin of toxin-antitoxin system